MDAIVCNIAPGGVLDNIVTQFANAGNTWQTKINPIAKKIFFILFGMEFMWQLVVKKVFAGDIEKLWVFFFTRTVLCFFFAKYIINVELYQQIIEYFASLGGATSGYTLSLSAGQNFKNLGPSEIIGNFSCISQAISNVSDGTGALDYITLKLTLAIIQVVLLLVLSLTAFYIIKVILQAYFLLYAGFILTGFAGSSWTKSFWQRYLQAVSGVAIKFLTVSFLLGVLMVQMKGWATDITAAKDIVALGAVILKVLGSAVIIGLLCGELPEWAASVLAGNVSMQFGEGMTSAVNTVSGVISGGVDRIKQMK
jgi:P-type conjugative transfer protein TrbL